MITIQRYREFLLEIKNTITGINYQTMVVDDSELVSLLKEREDTDNTMLIGVMPDFQLSGQEDASQWTNLLMIMVLQKVTQKDTTDDEYILVYQQTQQIAKEIVYLLLEQKSDNTGICEIVDKIVEDSIAIKPVYKKAGCNGWMIEIDLITV